jgi:acyl carrier protein
MVPSAFVVLESLPRTPNGKLDRRALPDPERLGTELRDSYVAPRTATEETLARIWSEVLGVDRIGIRDSFFDLGGHSLLATQVLMRVREAFQIEVPLRNLFATPTVEGLAIAVLESEAANTDDDELMQMLAELQL